ncbi:ABC transporter ATP-binding protein [Cellulomonas composti]|uniref:Aliphatic sulfonates import ATP-binding protein SsuB 2 n=1 Tax=Cellulomonas composti TaxID=266130 RepID=A0A511J848_9CELL|nr:ABC transporter ATP-binding protein [Cellulomonas composti]GEL94144.1 aliphatic sulfonates import ATP-binding protein SsuB 2 [Cellulomonas composti]
MSAQEIHLVDADAQSEGAHVDGVTKSFDGRRVLDGVRLDVAPGEFVALLGASGSGKTTLLRILAGLEDHDEGTVSTPRERTVVFQEPRLVAAKRVLDNVRLGLRGRESAAAASAALAEVGLAGRERAWPTTLSGGEAQRVALARALVRRPGLLLLDEPFAALDALTRMRMQALVAQLVRAHRPAALLVTHDVDEAILLADRVAVLQEGRIGALVPVPFPRPRRRGVPGFGDLRRTLLAELGVQEAIGEE